MNPAAIGSIVDAVGGVIDDLVTTDEERAKLALQHKELDQRETLAQIGVNNTQAAHPSVFVAGGRPAILWVGVAALAWTFVAHPLLMWVWHLLQALGHLPPTAEPPPTLDIDQLMVLVGGLLGVSGFRSYDKRHSTDTKRVTK